MVVIVLGLPGSGKSYFASQLARRIKANYLSSDKLRKELFPVRTYSDEEKESVYKVLLTKAMEVAKKKSDVVVDATFYKRNLRKKALHEISPGETVKWIEVKAEETLIRDRLTKPRIESEADFNVYLKLKEEWEPMNEDHLIIESTNENLEDMMKMAIDYLNISNDRK